MEKGAEAGEIEIEKMMGMAVVATEDEKTTATATGIEGTTGTDGGKTMGTEDEKEIGSGIKEVTEDGMEGGHALGRGHPGDGGTMMGGRTKREGGQESGLLSATTEMKNAGE